MDPAEPSGDDAADGGSRRARVLVPLAVLFIPAGLVYFALGGFEKASPRLDLLRRSWGTIAVGTPEATLVGLLGKPDADHAVLEQIPACLVPCPRDGEPPPSACTEFHTCVRSVSWHSHPEGTQGASYSACLDGQGIVRRLSQGSYMQFNMVH